MKNTKKFLFSLSLLSVALLFTFVISCKKEEPLETTGDITGLVTEDGSNTAIEAANVTLSGISTNYKTGSDGKFEIKGLEEGDYIITIEKRGYLVNKKQITVKAGRTMNADFTLRRELSSLSVSPKLLAFGDTSEKMTFVITNQTRGTAMTWEIDKPGSAAWLTISPKNGVTEEGVDVITVTVDRSKMPEARVYSTELVVRSTNGGGTATVKVTTEKAGALLSIEPTSLNFGTNENEKTLLVKNATQVETLTYKSTANESWIKVEDGEGTISRSEVGNIKISVSRLGLPAGNHNGTVVVKSNKNTVSVNVSMEVLAKQAPSVSSLQSTEVKHNAVSVSAYIADVGSAAVTAYGFCWGSSPQPTTADNKINLGGTSTSKTFNSTITGLTPSTQYYIRAYATNEEGTSYSDAISINTVAPPTLAVIRTFAAEDIKYNQVTANGSIDDLGDGYVTAHGFCYSTSNPNPTLSDGVVSLGSTTQKGNFIGDITGLQQQTKYFVRAYATNSLGTSYGGTVEFTTPIAPPLVTGGLIAYYTFDNSNCDDYFGETNYSGILQGSGQAPTFTSDIPGSSGKAMKCTKGKYYYLTMAPDQSVTDYTYAVWVKTKSTGIIYTVAPNNYYWANRLSFYDNKVYHNKGRNPFGLDLSTILFDGQWHHVVVIRRSDSRKLYIDGRYYASSGDTSNNLTSTASIGEDYLGSMDNLRIYNRALSIEEIKEIYNARQ